MEETKLREVHNSETPIVDFQTLCDRVSSPEQKILVACVGALISIGAAETLISFLTNVPETLEDKLAKTMYGIPVRNLLGATAAQAERMGLNASQFQEIKNYLGLTDNSAQASKSYVAGIRE